MMKLRESLTGAAVALAIVAALAGCSRGAGGNQADGAPTVSVARVTVDSVMVSHVYPGHLVSEKAVDVVSRIDGTLLSKHYDEGDYVRKGQVLFTIESTTYADLVRQAEADLESAKSAYEYASSRYAAVKRAMESDAVSQMELALAESNMKQAAATISGAEAALHMARFNLGLCTVKAPVSGRITAPTVSIGSYVDGDDTAFVLATIYDDKTMTAVFDVADRRLIELLRAGGDAATAHMRSVGLDFDEPLDHAYTASLSYIAPSIDPANGSVQMKARVDNPFGELRNGMSVRILFPPVPDPAAMLVKDASVATDGSGSYVYCVDGADRIVRTPVKVGALVNDSMRIVTAGLTPASRYIVTAPSAPLTDGMTITPSLIP